MHSSSDQLVLLRICVDTKVSCDTVIIVKTKRKKKVNKYEKLKALLQEMIDSGKEATLPLNMRHWYCETACCLCGDVALSRCEGEVFFFEDSAALEEAAEDFSHTLNLASWEVFRTSDLSRSIYDASSEVRLNDAMHSNLLTDDELKHPHLNSDHSEREIAHDYIRLIIKKVEEKENEVN